MVADRSGVVFIPAPAPPKKCSRRRKGSSTASGRCSAACRGSDGRRSPRSPVRVDVARGPVLGAMREEARMLSTELNKTLTQIGPGTQMGTLMRRYWLPALLSSEAPSRTVRRCGCGCWARISWRSATRPARSALIEAYCPHRRAPMFFGRQRGGGAAVRLPRLEVRCGRELRRHALRAARQRVQAEGEHRLLHDGRVAASSRSSARGGSTRPADYEWLRAPSTHRRVSKTLEHTELPPGARGRDRHRALVVRPQQRARQPGPAEEHRRPSDARGRQDRLSWSTRASGGSARNASTSGPINSCRPRCRCGPP